MLDNNIQNNTQNENEKVVQNGIQNVHQKFTARQNELRLYIINFTIDNKRPYNLESDRELTLQMLQMDENLQQCARLTLWEQLLHFIRIQKYILCVQCVRNQSM